MDIDVNKMYKSTVRQFFFIFYSITKKNMYYLSILFPGETNWKLLIKFSFSSSFHLTCCCDVCMSCDLMITNLDDDVNKKIFFSVLLRIFFKKNKWLHVCRLNNVILMYMLSSSKMWIRELHGWNWRWKESNKEFKLKLN